MKLLLTGDTITNMFDEVRGVGSVVGINKDGIVIEVPGSTDYNVGRNAASLQDHLRSSVDTSLSIVQREGL